MSAAVKKHLKKIPIFFIAVFFFSCSFNGPEIPELSVKILKIETDKNSIEERLSVFLLYKDENGRSDYSSIQVVHLESGFTWVLNRENSAFFSSALLRASDAEKILWAGSNKIADPFGRIPLGEYSVIAEDLSGNRAIKKITIRDSEVISSLPFTFKIQNKRWKLEASSGVRLKNFSLILLGADKQPLIAKILPYRSEYDESLEPLLEKYPDTRYVQCMAQKDGADIAYLTKYHSLY